MKTLWCMLALCGLLGLTAAVNKKSLQVWHRPATKNARDTVPGKGLNQHPFLYAGEWQNSLFENQKMYVVKNGAIAWEYTMPQSGEFGDATLLSNGNILFARFHGASEVSPDKKTVWNFDAPPNTEIHTCQPIGLNEVFMMFNSLPAKAVIMDKSTNKIIKELIIPTGGTGTHGMFRHCRYTRDGTFLIAHMDMNKVVEYDETGKAIWWVNAMSPWAAIRLKNGNTLISGNSYGYVREVNKKGETVWEFTREDAKAQNVILYTVQQACRLQNGNTVIGNWTGNIDPAAEPHSAQVIEITPAKKIVWVLSQWVNPNLNRGSGIQLLDEKGNPENGGLQR